MEAALGHFASGNLKKKRLFFFGKKNVEYRGSEVPDLGYPLSRAPDRPWAFHHASPYKVVYRGTLGSDNFCGLGVPSGVLDPRSRIWPKTPGIACFRHIWPPLAKTRTLPSNRERTPIMALFAIIGRFWSLCAPRIIFGKIPLLETAFPFQCRCST